jgi:hypothetical protein
MSSMSNPSEICEPTSVFILVKLTLKTSEHHTKLCLMTPTGKLENPQTPSGNQYETPLVKICDPIWKNPGSAPEQCMPDDNL